ncbi:MAG: sigma-70 family RNA polymerase sigma factor [Gammaproteobacteria bacterium]|nr:sigma-70 family RNA polymerase sigma factor [Gammaproteobacteria bacterium]
MKSAKEDVPTLVADALEGCEHARQRLVGRASALARRVALAQGGTEIDDAVQNTVVRVIESLASLTDAHAFDAWVAVIARNEVRMQTRGEIRWRQLHLALQSRVPEWAGVKGDGPFADDSPPRNSRVRAAVARLPPNQRDLIRARYVHGESYREIGARLRVSTSAVKSRLHRARKQLKEEMDNMSHSTPARLSPADVRSLGVAELFSPNREDSRPGIHGVLLDRRGYAVATDGARLLVRRVAALRALDADVLVHPNGAEALTGGGDLTVHLDEVRLALAAEELAWGISPWRFPDYRKVLPRDRDVLMRVRVRASDLTSATDALTRAATRSVRTRADHVRLSLLPGGTLLASALVYEADGRRAREAAPSPVELRHVEVAKDLADQFFHLRVPRKALLALDGLEVSLSVTRHGVLDMSDGKHRVLTMCVKVAEQLAVA